MKLIVGLGNPGRSYAHHRHNLGFRILDALAERNAIDVKRRSFGALLGDGVVAGQRVILVKPQTMMNLSGESVRSIAGYYRISGDGIVVIHDDLDLELGRIKFEFGRGAGGHNGVSSIMDELATSDFFRLRGGIGRSPEKMDPADYVLSPFPREERREVEELIEKAALAVEEFLEHGLSHVQQKYH